MVGFRKNFSRCRYAVYLNRVQIRMLNLRSSFDIIGTWNSHSLMVHARVSEDYIPFPFMYTTYNTFPVLPIKDLINYNGDLDTQYKLATSTEPSVSYLRV